MAQLLLPATCRFSSIHPHTTCSTECPRLRPPSFSVQFPAHHSNRSLRARAFDTESDGNTLSVETVNDNGSSNGVAKVEYPSGEFVYRENDPWASFLTKCKMLVALPWQRVKKGSILTIKLRGEISDQLKSRFSSGLSLPQICENFIKAAYDPRISGIYLQVEPLSCGWGKVEEIHRHILDFKKSGDPTIVLCKNDVFFVGFCSNCSCTVLLFENWMRNSHKHVFGCGTDPLG